MPNFVVTMVHEEDKDVVPILNDLIASVQQCRRTLELLIQAADETDAKRLAALAKPRYHPLSASRVY